MTGFESSPVVSIVERVPRKSEYLVKLSDGSEIRVLEDQLDRFGIEVGVPVDRTQAEEINFAYAYGIARRAAFRLLKVRPRTEWELKRQLQSRKIPGEAARRLIEDLKAEGHLDDRAFARLWIAEKISGGTHGRRLLEHQLRARGIAREVLEEVLAADYSFEAEAEVAGDLAAKKLSRFGRMPEAAARRRAYSYLLRRGFASEVAADAVERAASRSNGEDLT
jgi:regulatory protein